MVKIAIQGFEGCFHEMAAKQYFINNNEVKLIYCDTFEQVFHNIEKNDDTMALVAIENTIAGSLLHNY